VDEDIVAAKQL